MDSSTGIRECLSDLMGLAQSGFAIALHIKFTTPTYLFQTYPKPWIDYYSHNGLVMRDPTVIWGFDNIGVIRWQDLSNEDTAGIIPEASKYGMKFGFTYSLDRSESRSLSSFTSPGDDFTDQEIADICAIVDKVHDSTLSLTALSAESRAELKRMSIIFTHP